MVRLRSAWPCLGRRGAACVAFSLGSRQLSLDREGPSQPKANARRFRMIFRHVWRGSIYPRQGGLRITDIRLLSLTGRVATSRLADALLRCIAWFSGRPSGRRLKTVLERARNDRINSSASRRNSRPRRVCYHCGDLRRDDLVEGTGRKLLGAVRQLQFARRARRRARNLPEACATQMSAYR